MDNKETSEQEYWGDDELIAKDISGTQMLQRANLTAFFNSKGFPGTYPALLFFSDEAERLNDLIFGELSRAQAPDSVPRFVIDVHTKFTGETEAASGEAVVVFRGSEAISEGVRSDVLSLMRDGIKQWLEEAYSTHGKTASLEWTKMTDSEAFGLICPQ
ncbi:MAG: hypothetical protein SOW44_07005 [Porphyromonas sp.]|nr:hypothetical protein [Bacteroidales bacterium]MDY3101068.1 hypothetical protein [Porphyromonas sp.]